MELQLVDFEQAQLLKKLGFDWKTADGWSYFNNSWNITFAGPDTRTQKWEGPLDISRPTVALALKWLRDVMGVHVVIRLEPSIASTHYIFSTHRTISPTVVTRRSDFGRFATYELAESAFLTKVLDSLKHEQHEA